MRPDAGLTSRVVFHGSVPRELVLRAFAEAMAWSTRHCTRSRPLRSERHCLLGPQWSASILEGPLLTSYWPHIPSRVVSPSTPGRTAREIAAALNAVVGGAADRTCLRVKRLSKGCWTRIDLQSGPGGLHKEVSTGASRRWRFFGSNPHSGRGCREALGAGRARRLRPRLFGLDADISAANPVITHTCGGEARCR